MTTGFLQERDREKQAVKDRLRRLAERVDKHYATRVRQFAHDRHAAWDTGLEIETVKALRRYHGRN